MNSHALVSFTLKAEEPHSRLKLTTGICRSRVVPHVMYGVLLKLWLFTNNHSGVPNPSFISRYPIMCCGKLRVNTAVFQLISLSRLSFVVEGLPISETTCCSSLIGRKTSTSHGLTLLLSLQLASCNHLPTQLSSSCCENKFLWH